MRRPASLLAMCLAVLVLVTGACAGSRPALNGADPPTSTADPSGGSKLATLDPNAAGVSVVATAATSNIDIYDSPGAAKPFRSLKSPNVNGVPVVFLVEGTRDNWLRVLLPVRPNGSVGWIRAGEVTLSRHNYHIEVRLSEFRIKVTQGNDLILETSIGVAKDNTPTPGGRYYTTELLRPPSPNTVYGTYAYGLSGFSEVLETFNGGPGQLGIHGTNDPTSIGQKVSSGCVRLRNEDINKLAAVLPLGVPVEIIK